MKIALRLFSIFLIGLLTASGQMLTTTGHVLNSKGEPLQSGTVYFQPVTNKGVPLAYKMINGQSTKAAVAATVSNGLFTIPLPDTDRTQPLHVCFRMTSIDAVTQENLYDNGYSCIQPAASATWCNSSSCNLDNFAPNQAAIAIVQTGPAATVAIGSVSTGAAGSTPEVSNAGDNYHAVFNFKIPSGGVTTTQLGTYQAALRNSYINVFDKSIGMTADCYIDYTTGVRTTLSDHTYQCTPLMAVQAGGYLISNLRAGTDGLNGLSFYDAAGAALTGTGVSGSSFTAGTAVSVPVNAAFASFGARTVDVSVVTSGSLTGVNAVMVVPRNSLPSSYVGFGSIPQAYVDAQISSTTTTLTAGINGRMTPQQAANWRQQQQNKFTNIFDSAVGLIADSYIDYTTGAQVALADHSYKSTPFLSVIPGGKITVSATTGSDGLNGVAFYDASMTFIPGSGIAGGSVPAGTTISVPANAMYVRIGYKVALISESTLMVILGPALPPSFVSFGAVPQSYVDTQVSNLNATIAAKADLGDSTALSYSLLPAGMNLLVQSTVTKDAGVSRVNGTLTTGLTNVYATDYILVVPGQTYTIKVAQISGNAGFGVAYYNKSKVFVSAGPALPWVAGTTFTVPAGVFFIRSTGYYAGATAELTTQMITAGSTPPTAYALNTWEAMSAAQASVTSKVSGPWYGKRACVWGDSISASYSQNWQNRMLAFHTMTLPFQDARHGRRIAEWDENYTLSAGVYTRKTSTTSPASVIIGGTVGNTLAQDVAACDLMIAELGTNTPLESFGTVNDAAGSGTTVGYMKTMLEALTNANPAMRVVWVLPYRADPSKSAMATDAQYQALRTVIFGTTAMYGVAPIDMGALSGIGSKTWLTLLRDGVHPTDTLGFSRFASVLNYQLLSIGAN